MGGVMGFKAWALSRQTEPVISRNSLRFRDSTQGGGRGVMGCKAWAVSHQTDPVISRNPLRCRDNTLENQVKSLQHDSARNDLCSTRQILPLFRGQLWGDC